jgi:ribosomal protein S18 acetylase RimI-like enzyme
MKVSFSLATEADASALAALHTAVSEDLTYRYGPGFWSSKTSERAVLQAIRSSRVVVAHTRKAIVGTLRLQTKKPWAIDISYFTPVKTAIYLTGMAVIPEMQRKGIGRKLLREAVKQVRAWPGDGIRLDAFDSAAGAGEFYSKCGFREVAHVVYKKDPLIYFELLLRRLR